LPIPSTEVTVSVSEAATSNLTFNMLFLPTLPNPGVVSHAPGGTGVCIGNEFDRDIVEGGVASPTPLGSEGPGIDWARLSGDALRAGVCIHAPGGLGVFMRVRFPVPRIGVIFASSSSEDNSGGPGRSGMPFGGEGVWNSILDVLNDAFRGGVASESTGSVGENFGGEGGGVEVCDPGEPKAIGGSPGGVEDRGRATVRASGVLPIGESSSLPWMTSSTAGLVSTVSI
jgi:hypothetical protein